MGETFNFHTPPTNDKEEIEEKREREKESRFCKQYIISVLVYQFAGISHGNMNNLNLEISKKGSFKEVFLQNLRL